MKFRILMFDGRPVEAVLDDRIIYTEPDKVVLLDADMTIQKMIDTSIYREPHRSRQAVLYRKCEMEDVELNFLKRI